MEEEGSLQQLHPRSRSLPLTPLPPLFFVATVDAGKEQTHSGLEASSGQTESPQHTCLLIPKNVWEPWGTNVQIFVLTEVIYIMKFRH